MSEWVLAVSVGVPTVVKPGGGVKFKGKMLKRKPRKRGNAAKMRPHFSDPLSGKAACA